MANCKATYEDLGYQCEAEEGHRGPHFFTSSVEWEGCWSCKAQPGEKHEGPWCEAVGWPDEDAGAPLPTIIVGQEEPGILVLSGVPA